MTIPRACALLLAGAAFLLGCLYATMTASGADAYGYLNQAEDWLHGGPRIAQPWQKLWRGPNREWLFTPLGYLPDPDEPVLVPKYFPGLPFLMAGAAALAGTPGMFLVVPLAGTLLVALTYVLGERLGSPRAGLIGAWLMLCSPTFLHMLILPMSDVPVAAAWTGSYCLLLGSSAGEALGAGLMAGLAILIRVNLAPLALLQLGWLAVRRGPWWAWLAGLAPGCLAVAAVNQILHGSPWETGYGAFDDNFDLWRGPGNLALYLRWLVESQTPAIVLGLAALVFPLRRIWPQVSERRFFLVVVLFLCGVGGPYCLVKFPLDTWWYLRYLLPCFPFLLVGLASVLLALRLPRALLVPLVLALGFYGLGYAREHAAFSLWKLERRYLTMARLVHERTPGNSVFLSMQHSGSLRYYCGRLTMRYDQLDPAWRERAVDWLVGLGLRPYLVAESWEMEQVTKVFPQLERPLLVYEGPHVIFLYDLLVPPPRTERVLETFSGPRWQPRSPQPTLMLPPAATAEKR